MEDDHESTGQIGTLLDRRHFNRPVGRRWRLFKHGLTCDSPRLPTGSDEGVRLTGSKTMQISPRLGGAHFLG